jgi:hypothetical protein
MPVVTVNEDGHSTPHEDQIRAPRKPGVVLPESQAAGMN